MDRLPVFLKLEGQATVIVGGGEVAARKARLLREAGARVTIIAPSLGSELAAMVADGVLEHRAESFEATHLDGARLVIAATADPRVNDAVARAAAQRGQWVNVVDDAQRSTALMPSIVDRSPVIVAVSTGGESPVLARRLRERLEAVLDDSLGPLARLLGRWRERLLGRWPDAAQRRRALDALLDGEFGARAARGDIEGAEGALRAAIEASPEPANGPGRVTLVGAGPGDPGLLTLKALRALQRADVVLHDRLVSAEILALARRDAYLVNVGKMRGGPSTPQKRIHQLLIAHARAGRDVVRLKGGDPFVFGRGAEEVEALAAAGITVDVIPGITAALALAAAGIPLTHRDLAAGVRLVTAQRSADGFEPDWKNWAEGRDTLVVYMGTGAIERLRVELLRHGLDPATPVAFVENASRPGQRVVRGRLAEADALVARHGIRSPSIVVVGRVAGLADHVRAA